MRLHMYISICRYIKMCTGKLSKRNDDEERAFVNGKTCNEGGV